MSTRKSTEETAKTALLRALENAANGVSEALYAGNKADAAMLAGVARCLGDAYRAIKASSQSVIAVHEVA